MYGVSKLTVTENVSILSFYKMPDDGKLICLLLERLDKAGINIDGISQTAPHSHHVNLSFTVQDKDLVPTLTAANELSREYPDLKPMVSSENCKLQLFGEEMRYMHGVASSAISAVSAAGVDIRLITTSEVDISILVSGSRMEEALNALKNRFVI
jgi:aspartate kinase